MVKQDGVMRCDSSYLWKENGRMHSRPPLKNDTIQRRASTCKSFTLLRSLCLPSSPTTSNPRCFRCSSFPCSSLTSLATVLFLAVAFVCAQSTAMHLHIPYRFKGRQFGIFMRYLLVLVLVLIDNEFLVHTLILCHVCVCMCMYLSNCT